jgi:recombination protein RecA
MARKAKASPPEDGLSLEERLVAKLGSEQARLASSPLSSDVPDYISTQCATLDFAIGRPGIPVRRLTVLYGREGSGKSTVAYHILAETQRRNGIAILIDAEHRYSRDRGERIGLDHSRLVTLTPTTMEECFQDIEKIVAYVREEDASRLVCIAIDSLAALPTKKQMEAEIDDAIQPGGAARLVSRELQKITGLISKYDIALVVVNQLRQHIDISGDPRNRERRKVMRNHAMIAEGPLVYYGSLFIYFVSIGSLGEKETPTGITVRADIRKNSIAPEGKRVTFDIDFLRGVDQDGSKLDLLERLGVIERNGAWYAYGGAKFQRRGFSAFLEEHPELEGAISQAPLLWLEG